ncbi:MAG TPA: O-methyltransferase [Gemmatimonadaceae bacterium]|nr:O-methyltransferase [Gemmatimonadaceae bacterium]
MTPALAMLLEELERFGAENDAREEVRERRMLNITADTGPFLALLVRATRATRVLEIGTSNGYSTLWLADAARDTGGRVTTVERSLAKVAMAQANLERGGLDGVVRVVNADAGDVLAGLPDASFDFVFLDSDRGRYVEWWAHLSRALAPGALMVVDNATSHAAELEPLIAAVDQRAGFTRALVPLGNGELLVHRSANVKNTQPGATR